MVWNVEHTDEFAEWYHDLAEAQQDDVTSVGLLLWSWDRSYPILTLRA